jgi:cell division septation protein DedD
LSLSPGAAAQPAPIAPRYAERAPAAGAGTPLALTASAAPTAAAPAAAAEHRGGYAVQVSSQRNEADARSSFRSLSAKYPSVLGGRNPIIRRADLGKRGVYYRAMVGPFASAEEAAALCSSLKAAGGQCLIQRN